MFGSVMDWAGDVNGDGFADLVVGNRNHDTIEDMGAAYIYYGSAGGFGSAIGSLVWRSTVYSSSSAFDYDYFGYDVAELATSMAMATMMLPYRLLSRQQRTDALRSTSTWAQPMGFPLPLTMLGMVQTPIILEWT